MTLLQDDELLQYTQYKSKVKRLKSRKMYRHVFSRVHFDNFWPSHLLSLEYFWFNLRLISRASYKTESAPKLTASKIRLEDSTNLLLPTFFLLSGCWKNPSKIISKFKTSLCSSKNSWAVYPQSLPALHWSLIELQTLKMTEDILMTLYFPQK